MEGSNNKQALCLWKDPSALNYLQQMTFEPAGTLVIVQALVTIFA